MRVLLLFWLLCAITCTVIAGGKCRSRFGWFCLGFLFGPFGIAMIGFLSALPAKPAAGSEKSLQSNSDDIMPEVWVCPPQWQRFDNSLPEGRW